MDATREDAHPLAWPEIGLKPHPFAAMFRMLAGEEREAFAENIADKGLLERVKVYEEMILDGRNRYLVLVEEGIFDPEIETWRDRPELFEAFEGTREEALDYAWALNAERRHDSASQRALSAERYANLRNVTQAEAAAKFGVSERQVNSAAKVIAEGEPELVQAVEEGRLPLYLAEQVADLDEDDQREVAEKPKREAAAVAKQKLQDPPPLAESGPLVKATDASLLVMFAAAVLEVGKAGHDVGYDTLAALVREHGLAADADDTMNLSRSVDLAIDLARKRVNLDDDGLVGRSWYAVLTAGMSDDLDTLKADFRQALVAFDQALTRGEKDRAGELKLLMEAILWHANGKRHFGSSVNDAPKAIRASIAPPPGAVPMWGQPGLFEIEVDGLPAMVELDGGEMGWGPKLLFQPTRFDMPFPRGGWVHEYIRYAEVEGDLLSYVRKRFADIVARNVEGKKTTSDDRVGMFFPEDVFRIADDLHAVRIARGIDLVDNCWPAVVAGLVDDARQLLSQWTGGRLTSGGGKRLPKSKHLATHIMAIGEDGLVPLADFPENGRYLIENNRRWRYVDDGTDPGADAVTARLLAAGAVPDRALYEAALAALTEPKGKLHQSTAAEAIRAGVAAGVSRAEMAEDLGHPIGTVLTWTARLGLTDGSRKAAAE